jgi:hypothetical protein
MLESGAADIALDAELDAPESVWMREVADFSV